MSTTPSADTPRQAIGAGSGPPFLHRRAIAVAVSSSIGSSSASATRDGTARAPSSSSGSSSGASRRAAASAVVDEMPATTMSRSSVVHAPPLVSIHLAAPVSPTSRIRSTIAGTVTSAATTAMQVTPPRSSRRRKELVRALSSAGASTTITVRRRRVSPSAPRSIARARASVSAAATRHGPMPGLWEPAHPAPSTGIVGDHLEFPVRRSVVGRQLDDDRPAQRLGDRRRAVDGDRRRRFERQRDRHVVETFAALDRNEQLRVEPAAVVDRDRRRPSERCPDRR